jgi:hypothetical protein
MITVVGIFIAQWEAELTVERLRAIGLGEERVKLLNSNATLRELAQIKTSETEQSGTAPAIGGVVGGALGAAGGMSAGAAAASLIVPGVTVALAVGLAGAAILGAGGAVIGAMVGDALEGSMAHGLPIDELYVYEDALRQSRTIIIALPDNDAEAEEVRDIMRDSGAESIDAARDNWWVGLRDAEKAEYSANNYRGGKELDHAR